MMQNEVHLEGTITVGPHLTSQYRGIYWMLAVDGSFINESTGTKVQHTMEVRCTLRESTFPGYHELHTGTVVRLSGELYVYAGLFSGGNAAGEHKESRIGVLVHTCEILA